MLIETPFGRVFHTGDWKIDETPVLGEAPSPEVLTRIGDEGVLALVCDSTNVFQDTASGSEEGVHKGMAEQVAKAKGRVLVTTFASNAARLQTIGRVATETGRRVCVAGRSLDRILRVAQATGYLQGFSRAGALRRSDAAAARASAGRRHRRARASRARRWAGSRRAATSSS